MITRDDLDWWVATAARVEWIWAKTYAQTAPHEYVVKGRTPGLTHADYVLRHGSSTRFGQPAKFYGMTNIYLTSQDGRRKWWTMDHARATSGGGPRAHVTDIDLDQAALRVRRALQRQAGGKLVLVQPKTPRSRRTIRLPVSVITALRDHREQQQQRREAAGASWQDSGLAFTTRTGGPIHPRKDYRSFRNLLARAGLRQIRLHDLRHTAASLMLAKEVPARVVMEVLGHSQISLT